MTIKIGYHLMERDTKDNATRKMSMRESCRKMGLSIQITFCVCDIGGKRGGCIILSPII